MSQCMVDTITNLLTKFLIVFICQICTKALRDPHLAVCCVQHFCESCLNHWFTRQCKQSCPHCHAEGEAFNHVIHKGLRSEVNQLKIRCSNHGEGASGRESWGHSRSIWNPMMGVVLWLWSVPTNVLHLNEKSK